MNVPNTLSLIRLLMVPVFAIVFFSDAPNALLLAGLVFMLAGITDVLDGYIARKYNKVTKLGRIIDPLADKLMQLTAFVCMAIAGIIQDWVIIILAAKEGAMMIGSLFVLKKIKDMPPSNVFGKAASGLFYCATLAIIAFPIPQNIAMAMLIAALAMSITALVSYIIKCKRLFVDSGKDNS